MFDRIRISKACWKSHEKQLYILIVNLVSTLFIVQNHIICEKKLANEFVCSFMNFTANIKNLWFLTIFNNYF